MKFLNFFVREVDFLKILKPICQICLGSDMHPDNVNNKQRRSNHQITGNHLCKIRQANIELPNMACNSIYKKNQFCEY